MTPELMTALHTHTTRMAAGMLEQLGDLLGDENQTLPVSGFVFRPADEEDVGEDVDDVDEHSWWVLEAHYVPDGESIAANLTNNILLSFDLGMTYGDACQKLIDLVEKASANPDQK